MPSKETEFRERLDAAWDEILSGQDSLPLEEVKNMLDMVGINIPNYKMRDILNDLRKSGDTKGDLLSKTGFEKLCDTLQADDISRQFKTTKQADKNAQKVEGDMGSVHILLNEEQAAFADWINDNMGSDKDVVHKLKIEETGDDLYEKMDDGVIFCKMINLAAPDTIDERVINTGQKISIFKQHENLTLAINSAKAIGCVVIGIDSHTLNSSQGKKWLVLGLVWQLIKMYLFKQITITQVPGLVNLLMEGEDINELLKLSPEQLLQRWVNHQLEKAGSSRRIKNFSDDIKDSEVYTELINQIAPKDSGVNKSALGISDLTQRAENMLEQAEKIDSRQFVTAKDVVRGHEKLNLAFVANLFNNHPGLDPPEEEVEDFIEETREEKMYRNWMNSLGVKPRVNYLYSDLYDGLIIFQLMDFIQPGIVDWQKRVKTREQMSKREAQRYQEILANCNYAVELGKQLGFVLVGIGGSDIRDGNQMLTLALIWQLMRAYTLSLLAQLSPDGKPVGESEIITWANNRLSEGGKDVQISSYKDRSIKTALPLLHLIDTIKPGVINWSLIDKEGSQANLDNAKYCVAIARKIGAPVYALPEDISEGKHKMVMTVFASLMLTDMK